MVEYKIYIYKEPAFSSIVFHSAKVNEKKLESELNSFAKQGWKVKTMEKEMRRTGLFWSREAFIFVLEREK